MRTRTSTPRAVCAVGTAVVIVLLAAGTAAGAAPMLQPLAGYTGQYVLAEAGVSGPVTVEATVRVDNPRELKAAWLVGLSDEPGTPPGALALVWAEETSGWFPVWSVQLHSAADLIAEGSPRRGSGALAGSSYLSLTTSGPAAGHVYRAVLSYDPATGAAAVGLTDLTDDKLILARKVQLKPVDGPLYPAAGILGSGVAFESFAVYPTAVPFGTEWDMLAKEEDRYTRLSLFRLTPGIGLAIRLGADPVDWPGSFRVTAVGSETVTLFEIPAQARTEELLLPFMASDLPQGNLVLRLEYVDESGKVWQIGSRNLLHVAATLEVTFGELRVADDGLHGTLTVRSQDETLEGVRMTLYAAVGAPDSREGQGTPVFEQELALVSRTPVPVAFTVPIATDAQLFSLRFDVAFDAPVATLLSGNQYHVLLVRN